MQCLDNTLYGVAPKFAVYMLVEGSGLLFKV